MDQARKKEEDERTSRARDMQNMMMNLGKVSGGAPAPKPKAAQPTKQMASKISINLVPAGVVRPAGPVTVAPSPVIRAPGPVVVNAPGPVSVAKPMTTPSPPAAAPAGDGDIICYVCMRKFGTREQLQTHEQISELHKRNLAAKNAGS